MKKVISGRVYDTETGTELGYDSYGYPRDFEYWAETLYRTRSGLYFIHGEGGPASKYAESQGQNQWSGGSEIIPVSEDVARKWSEEHLDGDGYLAAFGNPEDDTVRINVEIPRALHSRVKAYADDNSQTMPDAVRALLEQALDTDD